MPRVIVVGGGLSGLSAAHTLIETPDLRNEQRGANVLILDKNPFWGGNSTKATSGINGAGTEAQAAAGIQDSAKAFFDDTKESARDLARDDLIKVLTGRSGDAVNWLQNKFALDLSQVARLGGHSYERTHRGGAQFPGMTITYAQMEALEDLAVAEPDRVEIVKKARVTKLLRDADKAVIGVEYEHDGETIEELGTVILATGGYAADFSQNGLLNKYRPDLMHLPTTNGDHCTGDGQKMVIDIGGNGIDLEKVQVHPTGLVDPNEPDAKVKFLAAEALRGVGGLLLDREGNRFVDELGHRDYVSQTMFDHDKFPVRLILNGQATKEIEWHCKHYCGRGLMKRIETRAELAVEMGLSDEKLAQVFGDYEAVCADPKKDPFGKKFFHNTNWGANGNPGPFNVAVMTPVLHYTMGGLEIDARSRVLDTAGAAIPGLFACGEIAGGVHGANRLGGSSLLGCVVFGRVAGDEAASYLMQGISSGKIANERLNQIGQQLGMATTIKIDPTTKKVTLEFNWDDNGVVSSAAAEAAPVAQAVEQKKEKKEKKKAVVEEVQAVEQKEYTMEEVAAHNKKDDCWVVIGGQVLDATTFLSDHPGGPKAIMLYAGREATEEFEMVHAPSVLGKYASHLIIGTVKA